MIAIRMLHNDLPTKYGKNMVTVFSKTCVIDSGSTIMQRVNIETYFHFSKIYSEVSLWSIRMYESLTKINVRFCYDCNRWINQASLGGFSYLFKHECWKLDSTYHSLTFLFYLFLDTIARNSQIMQVAKTKTYFNNARSSIRSCSLFHIFHIL